ncbi:hypothetical protein OHA19_08030 [Streptomyces sp. NBC_00012]|uniref:hypothetical protein n=1 Tax=Streptomyces sp. NBC_00012 TaxID=2975621 RepID=UPI0032471938
MITSASIKNANSFHWEGKRVRTLAKAASATAISAALLATLGTGSASAAPIDSGTFNVDVPSTGYTTGTVNFFNRSVQITGSVKSNTTGCASANFQIRRGSTWYFETRTACGRGPGSSKGFNFTVDFEGAGAADYVYVELWDTNQNSVGGQPVVNHAV